MTNEGRALQITTRDVLLRRADSEKPEQAVGLSLGVLGERVLAQGRGWKFKFAPVTKDGQRSPVSAPISLAFRIANSPADYLLSVKDFAPVIFHVPAIPAEKPERPKSEA